MLKSDNFRDLFAKMVAKDALDRLSIDEILIHPWLDDEYTATKQGVREYFAKKEQDRWLEI